MSQRRLFVRAKIRDLTRRRRSRGQAIVEFALILPVFILLLLVAVDFGRVFFSYVQLNNAVREGANYAANAPTDSASVASRVSRERNVQGQGGEGTVSTPVITCRNQAGTTIACSDATGGAGAGNTVSVQVNENFTFLTPFINGFFGGHLTLSSSATAAVLGYAADPSATAPPSCSTSPSASFTIIVTSGLTVFANPSASSPNSGICNISGYNWAWGEFDGSGEELTTVGTATGDSHTFASPGTYTVVLEVTNQAGTSQQSKTVTVPTPSPTPTPTPSPTPTPTATPPGPTPTPSPTPTPTPTPVVCTKPVANFTATKSGKTYTYRDASTVANPATCPITDWLWTFTDLGGTQSNAQNPAPVTYGNNSSHPVTLKVTNSAGSSSITLSP